MTMDVTPGGGPLRPRTYPYQEFSELAGPSTEPRPDYRVSFKPVMGVRRRLSAYGLVSLAILFEVTFLLWLLKPSHYPRNDGTWQFWLSMGLVASILMAIVIGAVTSRAGEFGGPIHIY